MRGKPGKKKNRKRDEHQKQNNLGPITSPNNIFIQHFSQPEYRESGFGSGLVKKTRPKPLTLLKLQNFISYSRLFVSENEFSKMSRER
jgi:hypothetical protein